MRIGCLQFAPQVGDVDNNLNRADAVLNRSPEVDDLDIIILPELAFTGYNFKSLSEIAPYLEPTGSGISALWARTIALKHNCNVVVGYPEKVDVSQKWPTSPEYYNSAIMINPNGETVANYRKSFLYRTDETWALEGDGFFDDQLPGLGNVAMGICMDMNPYKFEAPFHAYEFAFHVLEVEANLVILTMSWFTREDPQKFTQLPLEPDMDTLEYWLARLEPIIRDESQEEIIVVFCNRTGIEGDLVYAGTSAVIGIKNGEVNLYGLLGRGTKELLVADTNKLPIAKVVREVFNDEVEDVQDAQVAGPTSQTASPSKPQHYVPFYEDSRPPVPLPPLNTDIPPEESAGTPVNGGRTRVATPIVRNDLGNWDFMANHKFSIVPSTTPHPNEDSRSRELPKLGLDIPTNVHGNSENNHDEKGVEIPTPTAPSPTPMSLRPNFHFPAPVEAGGRTNPSSTNMKTGASIVEVKRADSPMTPPSRTSANSASRLHVSTAEAPPSPPTDDKLGHSGNKGKQPERPAAAITRTDRQAVAEQAYRTAKGKAAEYPMKQEASSYSSKLRSLDLIDTSPATIGPCSSSLLDQPSEMKEKKDKKNTLLSSQSHYLDTLSAVSMDTRRELDLAFAAIETPPTVALPERPPSTKSRNASLPRAQSANRLQIHRRSVSQSHMSVPIIASPSVFRTGDDSTRKSQQSVLYFRPDSSMVSGAHNFGTPAQSVRSNSMSRAEGTLKSLPTVPGSLSRHGSSSSTSAAKLAGADIERPMSRGRQPFTKTNPTNGAAGASRQSQVIPRVAGATAHSRQPSGSRPNGTSDNRPNGTGGRAVIPSAGPASRTRGQSSTSSGWVVGPPPASMPQNPVEPGDEFIAVISRINDSCPVHSGAAVAATQTTTQSQQQNQRSQTQQEEQRTQQQQQQSATTATEQAQRTGSAQSQSNQAAGTPNQPAPAIDQSLYEVILAPHIRDIVESFTSRDRAMGSRVSNSSRQPRTPIFDPPTPTAMEFTPIVRAESAASATVKTDS